MQYLLDADWVINALAGKRSADVIIDNLSDSGIAIAATTVGEVYEGAFGAADPAVRLATLRTFLAPFPVILPEDSVLETFGRTRSELRSQGQLIPDFDIFIAATALERDLTLLTFNVRHFERISPLRLYRLL